MVWLWSRCCQGQILLQYTPNAHCEILAEPSLRWRGDTGLRLSSGWWRCCIGLWLWDGWRDRWDISRDEGDAVKRCRSVRNGCQVTFASSRLWRVLTCTRKIQCHRRRWKQLFLKGGRRSWKLAIEGLIQGIITDNQWCASVSHTLWY